MSKNKKEGSHTHQRYKQRSQPIVHKTLQFRINLLFLLLMLIMAITIIIVVQTIGKSLIIKENYRFIEQKGRTVVSQLGQQISYAEAIANSLANIAETLPKDTILFKRTIPQILFSKENHSRIAGGGVWPEPYIFEPKTERRSFFWSSDSENKPVYFNNYNDPNGPGYHSEEWYVPARYLKKSDTFWSKSYIDPYSNEPMVTCTAPIFENNQFSGVSTIDLKLNDLKTFLDKEAVAINGYIFAVDRNNKFLSFPNLVSVKTPTKSISDKVVKEFINAQQLAEKETKFKKIANALQMLNDKLINQDSHNFNDGNQLAEKIASESYQINFDEAKLIAATFPKPISEKSGSTDFIPITIENDFLLNGPAVASIFLMPKTHWKIVLVSPFSKVTGAANYISQQIFSYLAIGMLICVFIAYLYLRYVLVLPLRDMTEKLIKAMQSEENAHLMTLPETKKNELGDLAFWFNRRTEELRCSNEKLNQEINSHKESQKALNESERQLSIHLQNTPVGALSSDLDSKVMEWNPAAEKIFGYTKKEALGKNVAELILPEDVKDMVDSVFRDLFSGKGGERSINENITKDGRRILCDWYNTVLKNIDGKVIGVASLVNDITEKKRSEDIKKTLFAISNAVNITLNLNDLYKQVHTLLNEIIDVTNFFIAIVNKKKHTLYFPYYVDTVDEGFSPIANFNSNDSLTGFLVSNRKPLLLKNRLFNNKCRLIEKLRF